MELGRDAHCPPLIFALTLEPLLNRIRMNKKYEMFLCRAKGAYALFYVADPLISLPNIKVELQSFSLLSNFKINYNKSIILSLNNPSSLRTWLQSSFSFTWCHTLYNSDYAPLLSTIKSGSAQLGPRDLLVDWPSQCVEDECVTPNSVLSPNGAYLFTQVFLFDP